MGEGLSRFSLFQIRRSAGDAVGLSLYGMGTARTEWRALPTALRTARTE
jgi:hypothetical protein